MHPGASEMPAGSMQMSSCTKVQSYKRSNSNLVNS